LKIDVESVPNMESLFSIKEAIKYLIEIPIKHENVIAYAVQRLPEGDPFIDALGQRVLSKSMKIDWLENWFDGSLELVPESMRVHLAEKLDFYLGRMDEIGVSKLNSWNMDGFLKSKKCIEGQEKLEALISNG